MTGTSAEILLHPVRLRIMLAVASEQLTTSAISQRLPDVAQATLYRHVAALVDAGLLQVVAERRVRGGVERTYATVAEAAHLGPVSVAEMSADDVQRGLILFVGSLIEVFGRYLEHPHAKPAEDAVGYRQVALWLDAGERAELVERLRTAIGSFVGNKASADRQRVLLNTIIVPDLTAEPAEHE